jgi:hypothetical protein
LSKKKTSDPQKNIEKPALDNSCKKSIVKAQIPKLALANGLWLGKIPPELATLRFAEKLLISGLYHNFCIIKVSTGGHKLKTNVVIFAVQCQKFIVYYHHKLKNWIKFWHLYLQVLPNLLQRNWKEHHFLYEENKLELH